MGEIDRVIFVGPSLYGVKHDRLPREIWLPPAKHGDTIRAVLEFSPKQIVLIDGVFHQSLAVWHKEIVFALLEGIVCIGAASMGALRAAELWRYGMIGVGKIFEMYKAGEEDDSLVAMTFDPESYRPLSEAAVGTDRKREDALGAIEFARSYTGSVKTTLNSLATRAIQIVVDRILDEIPQHG
jgi:hypothetical protein